MKGAPLLIISGLCLFLSNCTLGPYYSKDIKDWGKKFPEDSSVSYTVYLIGDAGDPDMNKQEPTFKLLQSHLEKDSNSSVIFLGDNIYHNGLPKESDNGRKHAEKKINEQLDILKNYKGEIYFISGNHDWDYMKSDGLAYVKRQEEYIENYLNRGNTFIPNEGCPGPYSAKLNKNVILLAMDSQWWLHKYEKPYGRCGDCEAEDEVDFMVQFEDIMRNNQNSHLLIVAHHPLVSNGNHGGYYNILDHIFPLRLLQRKWYIPLPIIGSLYPLHRKFGGVDQDIPHYRYQEYKNNLLGIISKYDNVLFAAGHDHNLQYHKIEDSINHIISGSGSKLNPVKGGGKALFTYKQKGFVIIKYYSNGQAWAEFWVPEGNGEKGKLIFKTFLYERKTGRLESYCSLSATDYSDSNVIVKATDKYKVSKFKEFWFGHHYREEWGTPVSVPVLDLKTEKGGLIPYGIGGGKQSVSLKLKNIDDKEYVLRSINKDLTKAIPIEYRNTFIHDIVEDQISAQHPYGSLVIPKLADAVKVFHTNPTIVMIPDDSCLGPYREQFKNMLATFEEDADGNHDDVLSLGNSKKIVGTDRMRNKIEADNNNRIDERNFLRVRLFDMFIGDWDRHDRQYRWAAIETKNGNLYIPIPEDRDQAFFKFEGVIPNLASQNWALRNLQNFEKDFDDIVGLNLSSRFIDRRYLQSLTRQDWIEIADSMKSELSDEVIVGATNNLPKNIFALHGEEIISKLKSRRELLPEIAEQYYEKLAKYVDIFGSDKKEKFEVKRMNRNETSVDVYKMSDDGEIKDKIYSRTFYTKETKELRLYSLGADDIISVDGKVSKGIKIRILGGDGHDSITDKSIAKGMVKKTIVYDTKNENTLITGKETNKELSVKETIHYPNQDKFFYNYIGPQFSGAYNPEDGLFIGGGLLYRKYKFRGDPYGAQHRLVASWATRTSSMRIDYRGDIKNFLSGYNLGIDFEIYTPYFAMNYFGYGNETVKKDTADEFYRVRLKRINFSPSLNKEFTRFLTVGIGPKYQYYQLQKKPGTFLDETSGTDQIYSAREFAGIRAFFKLGTRDDEMNPTRGILLNGEANFNQNIHGSQFYSQYKSNFAFYITPNTPFQLTFAGRIGGGMNFGQYEFFQANTLGGSMSVDNTGTLRGYLRSRFIGDKSFYQNAEVRCELFKFNAYILPGKFGILGLFDNGRVWARNEKSNKWHMGYGGGIWLDIFHKLIFTTTISFSEEDTVINARMGFFF